MPSMPLSGNVWPVSFASKLLCQQAVKRCGNKIGNRTEQVAEYQQNGEDGKWPNEVAEPSARERVADADCIREPLKELDLKAAGVSSVIWATGYATDFSWLQVDTFGDNGKPRHQRGVGAAPGIYFVGLPWLSRRGSAFIWGCWQTPATWRPDRHPAPLPGLPSQHPVGRPPPAVA